MNISKNMMKFTFILYAFLANANTQSSPHNKVIKLSILNGIAYFETSQAKVSTLTCVLPAYQHQWSLDVTTSLGESQYLLLLSALTNSYSVEVASADDCKLVLGVERAQSLTLIQD